MAAAVALLALLAQLALLLLAVLVGRGVLAVLLPPLPPPLRGRWARGWWGRRRRRRASEWREVGLVGSVCVFIARDSGQGALREDGVAFSLGRVRTDWASQRREIHFGFWRKGTEEDSRVFGGDDRQGQLASEFCRNSEMSVMKEARRRL